MQMMRSYYFKEFLKFFWLRPENALLLSLRAEAYQSTLKYFGDGSNTIDVSCGDGVFSFIVLSGTLSNKTDMFRSLDLTSERKGNFDSFDALVMNILLKQKKIRIRVMSSEQIGKRVFYQKQGSLIGTIILQSMIIMSPCHLINGQQFIR